LDSAAVNAVHVARIEVQIFQPLFQAAYIGAG
jgi:hypothetical protein